MNSNRITEDYVSFETTKLLKEKGFDYQGFDYIDFEGEVIRQDRPTLQMAMRWLREVHNKHCDIGYDIDLKWFFQIIDLKETIEDHYTEMKFYHSNNQCNYKSYEDTVDAALKYVLKNLI